MILRLPVMIFACQARAFSPAFISVLSASWTSGRPKRLMLISLILAKVCSFGNGSAIPQMRGR
jgi:hypothetical protein